jgi:hypothetical protein
MDKLLEGLLGRGVKKCRLDQLKVTQMEMFPDRQGWTGVTFRATVSKVPAIT